MRKVNELHIDDLDEVSGVDRPAQPGARAVIFKREAPSTAAPGGDTLPVSKNTPSAAGANQESHMTDQKDPAAELAVVQKRVADLEAELAISKAIGAFSDAEKSLYATLDVSGKDAFRKLSPEQRALKVQAANDANGEVYKSLAGEVFRKNDDPRLIAIVKRADENERALLAERAERATDTLKKRAATELAHLPGEELAKVALLRAVDGIADESVRKDVAAMLLAGETAVGKAFTAIGSAAGAARPASDAEAASVELEKRAHALATTEKISIDAAFVKVLETPEGKALYNQSCAVA
jgi:hypothetical protein